MFPTSVFTLLLSHARPISQNAVGHHDVGVTRSIIYIYNHSYIRTYVFIFYFIQNESQLSQVTIL